MAEVTARRRIAVPPGRVFRALLDPADLGQWFCDTADVDPRVGGRYAFSGPHTYGGPATAAGRIVRLEADRSLAYVWPLAGSGTQVSFELAGGDGGTDLTAGHTGVTAFPYEIASTEHLKAVWEVLLRQLASHLDGRPLPRWDFTVAPPKVIDTEIIIEASAERVWEMLTVPAQMNRWIAKDAAVDLRVGGRYSNGWPERGDSPLEILELEPPRRLVISWRAGGVIGMVTWVLEASGDHRPRTRLRLIHVGLPQESGVLRDYDIGWWDFLMELRRLTDAMTS